MRQGGFVFASILFVFVILLGSGLYLYKSDLIPIKNYIGIFPTTTPNTTQPTQTPDIITPTPSTQALVIKTPIPTKKPTTAPTPIKTTNPTSITTPTPFVNTGPTVRLTGRVYADSNCNEIPEPNENGIAGVTVNIFLMPSTTLYSTVTSDNNGYYVYSTTLASADSYITVQPSSVGAWGYKIHAQNHTTTLSKSQSSINIDLPQVPAANIDQCN